jgi:hypothetical protein
MDGGEPLLVDHVTAAHKGAFCYIAAVALVHSFWYFSSAPDPPVFFSRYFLLRSWPCFARALLSPLVYAELGLGTWFEIAFFAVILLACVFSQYTDAALALAGALLFAHAGVLASALLFPAPALGRRTLWFFLVYASKLFPESDFRAGDFAVRVPLALFAPAYAGYLAFTEAGAVPPFLFVAALAHLLLFANMVLRGALRTPW